MMRFILVACLTIAIALAPTTSRAVEDKDNKILGLSNTAFAVGVATVVTGARVAFVMLAGNTLFGQSLGTGLLVLYLGHVVAEGILYGAGAGASAYAMSSATSEAGEEQPPSILPQRLAPERPTASRLPLEMALPPEIGDQPHP
jgi:hypothetical protein